MRQTPVMCNDVMQSVTNRLNAAHTSIGCPSVAKAEKAGQTAGSIQSIKNKKFYETKEEKHQFVGDSFKLEEIPKS